ncbi:hypothetical protein EDB81DRAFT_672754, partial [Dactylonectria macrodidyma]
IAASYFGDTVDNLPGFQSAWWEAREKMCYQYNKSCGWQQPCTVVTTATRSGNGTPITARATLQRSKYVGKRGFKDCWVCY